MRPTDEVRRTLSVTAFWLGRFEDEVLYGSGKSEVNIPILWAAGGPHVSKAGRASTQGSRNTHT